MGQFLAIGIPYQIFVSPERAYKPITLDDVRTEMERSLLYDLSLYEAKTDGTTHIFTLKLEPLFEGLLPFLEAFYPAIHPNEEKSDWQEVLEKLRNTPFEQWLEMASNKSYCAFQLDKHSGSKYLELQIDFRPTVRIRLDCIILHLGYGKVITEGIGDFTRFFKYCFREAFAEHPLAKAVEIYVTD